MGAAIAVISEPLLIDCFRNIAEHRTFECTFYNWSDYLDRSVAKNDFVALDVTMRSAEDLFNAKANLRLNLSFEGQIIVLSFGRSASGELTEHGPAFVDVGCVYVRLPLVVDELVWVLSHPRTLSRAEMALVRKQLSAARIARDASVLRHEYENKFSLALAYLRELEKLSHFTNVDRLRVLNAVSALRLHLTREKIDGFQRDLSPLLEAVKAADLHHKKTTEQDEWEAIHNWLQFCERLDNGECEQEEEVFRRAKRTQTAIKNLLTLVKELKHGARQVGTNDQQNLVY